MAEENGSGAAAQGNPAGGEGAAAGQQQAASAPWYDGFQNAELKAWIANKQYESPEADAYAHWNLEKLLGHDKAGRTVVLPGENATPEEIAAFQAKLGRPEKPDGYEFPKEGVDENFVKWARDAFHEIGLPAKQAKALVDKWQEMTAGATQARQQEMNGRFTAEADQLKREWGAAFEDKTKLVDRAVKEFGLDETALAGLRDAWGPYKAMTFFEKIGSSLGEGSYVSGEGSRSFSGAMTPDQARGRINELKRDASWTAKYLSGDAAARQELDRLHKWAYPEA